MPAMMRRCASPFISSVVLASLLAACGSNQNGGRPRHLVLITLDTTRQDRLSCYGHEPVTTPHLDELARRGVLFEQAYAAAAVTLPAHATIMTGTYPYRHGARANGLFRVGEANTTLAEQLHAAGFATGAFVAASVLDHRFGLEQGFDQYDDDVASAALTPDILPARDGAVITDRALAWVRRTLDADQAASRLFVWAHYFDAHLPRNTTTEQAHRFADPYDAEIAYMDAQVGRLLDGLAALGVLRDALVIAVADHGEGLGDHQEETHGLFIYDEIVKVPWLMAGPGVPGPMRVTEVVRTVDLLPTALDLLGVEPAGGVHGVSLGPRLAGAPSVDLAAYFETFTPHFSFGWSWERGVRLNDPPLKMIDAPRPELYDLGADPDERNDLSAESPERLAELERRLAEESSRPPTADLAAPLAASGPLRARLAALGYTTGSLDGNTDRGADVKDRVADFLRKERASEKLGAGDPDGALALADGLLERFPKKAEIEGLIGACWLSKAHRLRAEGRADEARQMLEKSIAHYQAGLRERPESAQGHFDLAAVYDLAGRKQEAARQLELCLRADETILAARFNLGVYLVEKQAWARALEQLEKLAPFWDQPNPEPIVRRSCLLAGFCLQKLGRLEEARARFEQALKIAPDWPEPDLWLGRLLAAAGRTAEARRHLERYLERTGGHTAEAAQVRRLLERLGPEGPEH